MVLGLKEGLVDCATVCVKSVVILLGPSVNHISTLGDLVSQHNALILNDAFLKQENPENYLKKSIVEKQPPFFSELVIFTYN